MICKCETLNVNWWDFRTLGRGSFPGVITLGRVHSGRRPSVPPKTTKGKKIINPLGHEKYTDINIR